MVRVWHEDVVPFLDDNRLPAAHAEIHYIMNALGRGRGLFWRHPETQRFYKMEPILRHLHDQTVEHMTKRGMNHKSPLDGPRMTPKQSVVLMDRSTEWMDQDLADLYRKWTMEGRIHDGMVELGAAVILPESSVTQFDHVYGKLKGGKCVVGFKAPRTPIFLEMPLEQRTAFIKLLAAIEAANPHREWGEPARSELHALMDEEERGASTDPYQVAYQALET
jgi:hypothetical protein